jgi:serine/threonine protein kinase
VKMLGEGEENSFCWYAMERVTGTDLRERLKSGPLSADEVRALAATMLDALEVVHAAGFVHRDVKPSNILLSAEGPKLCDFGIARLEGASTLTESAALLGSLRYMAPEQRWGKSDARSDLYALGVVMHEALALGVPGEKTLPPNTPSSLTRVIAKLTETNAVLRPQSAAAARRLLRPSSKRPGLFAGAALIAVLGGVAFFTLPPPPTPAVVAPSPVDAGPAVAVVAEVPADAGQVEAAPLDAGLFAELTSDAGNPMADVIGVIGTKRISTGSDTDFVRGKPTKKPLPFEPPAPKPSPKSKIVKAPTVAPELSTGSLQVLGTGAATVFDGKRMLGGAPGTFSISLGGHAVFVVCKADGKRTAFKVSLSGKKPSEQLNYSCPG